MRDIYNAQPTAHNNQTEPLFDTSVVDSNATLLLDFLKSNCSTDNSTYLLQRKSGSKDITLIDATSLSANRQRRWTHWLGMMSARFAKVSERMRGGGYGKEP